MAEKVEYILSLKDLFTSKIKSAVNETERLNKSVSGVGSKLKTAFAGIAVGVAIKDIIDTTANYQSMTAAIKASSVTEQEGEKNIKFLNDEIDRLGLNLEATFKGFKTFQGAVKGTSLDGQVARKIFTGVSTAVTAMGLTGDDATGVFLAMGQMVSKGSVQAEELRGQLGERLPGAFAKAAQSMGYTTAQLGKLMQKGEITAEQLLPKLADALGGEFSAAALKAGLELRANMNRAETAFFRLKVVVGTELIPIVLKLIGYFITLTNVVKDAIKWGHEHRKTIGFITYALGGLVAVIIAYNAYMFIANTVSAVQFVIGMWRMAAAMEGVTIAQYALNLATAIFDALSGNYVALAAGAAILAAGIWGVYEAQKSLNKETTKGSEMKSAFGGDLVSKVNGIANNVGINAQSAGAAETGAAGGKTKSSGTEISAVEAKGHQNFNISIDKLVEQLTVQTTNLKESGNAVKAEITKALIGAVNDFQLMAVK